MGAKMSLMPGEQIVMSSDKDTLLLTTKRVRYDEAAYGSSNYVGITLDAIASCSLAMKTFPILLVFAAASFIGAISQRGNEQLAFFVVTAVLVAAYFFTRRAVISIASNGGEKILVPAKNMNRTTIIEFLEAVEQQKLQTRK